MKNSVKIHSFDCLWRKSHKRLRGLRKNLVKRIDKIDELIHILYWEDKQNNLSLKDTDIFNHFLKIYRALNCEHRKVNHIIFCKAINKRDINEFKNLEQEELNKDINEFKPYYL